MHGYYKELNYSYVIEDDEKGGYLATKHLVDLGHEKILGIFKIDDIQGHKRYNGYIKGMKEANIKINDSSVIWFSTEEKETMFDKHIVKRVRMLEMT